MRPPHLAGPADIERRRWSAGAGARAGCSRSLFVAIVLVCIALPLGQALYYSLTEWNGLSSKFLGLANYTDSIWSNPNIRQIVTNNVVILSRFRSGSPCRSRSPTCSSAGSSAAGSFARSKFLPTAFSWVVIGIAARACSDTAESSDRLLGFVGLGSLEHDWLGQPNTALRSIVLTLQLERRGLNTVILLSGMATLDQSVFEAAQLDGAGHLKMMRHVVLPWTRRFIDLALVITIVAAFTQVFDLIMS